MNKISNSLESNLRARLNERLASPYYGANIYKNQSEQIIDIVAIAISEYDKIKQQECKCKGTTGLTGAD